VYYVSVKAKRTTQSRGTSKSVRLPADLAAEAERRADELGLAFSDLVEAGLRRQVGWPANATIELLEACADSLRSMFPKRQRFPQDVTLKMFRSIRLNGRLRAIYDAAILGPDGKVSELSRDAVHRRLGKMVKAVLDAEVIGRSAPVEAGVELIRTHALLAPKATARRRS